MIHDTRKDPNMAMEERKCQMSWSSKNDSRIQSLLCSRDSAGVFCQGTEKRVLEISFLKGSNLIGRCVCVCVSNLPGAETLEEEIECKAPHNSREENTHQRQTLDSLTAPQLNANTEQLAPNVQNMSTAPPHLPKKLTCTELLKTPTFIMM